MIIAPYPYMGPYWAKADKMKEVVDKVGTDEMALKFHMFINLRHVEIEQPVAVA